MLNILVAILVFSCIVLIHELGHFLFAKLNKITVLEFSIGMGPRICSFVKGETRYSIKILPFGGSCMMAGEDSEIAGPGSFSSKSPWARISVIAAGPIFNFLLALIFSMVMVSFIGHDKAVLTGTMEGFPASEAGLMAGDKIVKINNRSVWAHRDISWYMISHPGQEVTIRYQRPEGGVWEKGVSYDTKEVRLTPKFSPEDNATLLGVQFPPSEKTRTLFEFLRASVYEVRFCIVSTMDSLGMLFRQQVQVDEAVAGPVRIVTMVGKTVETGREAGGSALLLVVSNWILLLSTSLGIMNLLPIPALDGGRLVFLFVELLRGKPVDPEKEGMVHMAGMMVLMALMVFVLFNDIRNLF